MLTILRVNRNSVRQSVSFLITGDPGHSPDATGVIFFEETMQFPPVATPAEIAPAVVARYRELYMEGYANWVHLQDLVAMVRSLL